MITLTRLNGKPFALNCDLIERAEETPDTVLTLVDGTKYVVCESVDDVVKLIREYRASVVALAQRLDTSFVNGPTLRVVPGSDETD
jgi:flagellar protein FlbD